MGKNQSKAYFDGQLIIDGLVAIHAHNLADLNEERRRLRNEIVHLQSKRISSFRKLIRFIAESFSVGPLPDEETQPQRRFAQYTPGPSPETLERINAAFLANLVANDDASPAPPGYQELVDFYIGGLAAADSALRLTRSLLRSLNRVTAAILGALHIPRSISEVFVAERSWYLLHGSHPPHGLAKTTEGAFVRASFFPSFS